MFLFLSLLLKNVNMQLVDLGSVYLKMIFDIQESSWSWILWLHFDVSFLYFSKKTFMFLIFQPNCRRNRKGKSWKIQIKIKMKEYKTTQVQGAAVIYQFSVRVQFLVTTTEFDTVHDFCVLDRCNGYRLPIQVFNIDSLMRWWDQVGDGHEIVHAALTLIKRKTGENWLPK